jgi:hypothetical protein
LPFSFAEFEPGTPAGAKRSARGDYMPDPRKPGLSPSRRGVSSQCATFDNGAYGVEFDYSYNLGQQRTVKASFTLARQWR